MEKEEIDAFKKDMLEGWSCAYSVSHYFAEVQFSEDDLTKINGLYDDLVHNIGRIVDAARKRTLASYLATKERTPTNRAPFGPPSISPSGIPLHEQTGAIPSVRIDADDSNDAHLGEADTGQVEIFPETNKGDQE